MSNLIGGVRFSLSYEGQKPGERGESHSVNSIPTVSTSPSHEVELDTISNIPESMDIFGMDTPTESPSTSPDTVLVDPQTVLISKLVGIFVIVRRRLIPSLHLIYLSIQLCTIRKRSAILFSMRCVFSLQRNHGCSGSESYSSLVCIIVIPLFVNSIPLWNHLFPAVFHLSLQNSLVPNRILIPTV